MRRRLATLLTTGALLAGVAPVLQAAPASAAAFPPGFTDTPVASGIAGPTAVAQLPDGHLLVTGQGGALTMVDPTTGTKTSVLTLSVCSGEEEGLLGVAVDPAYATNKQIYLYYTFNPGGECVNRVSRFTFNGASFDNQVVLLDNFRTFGNTNHNGGYLYIAKDGKLYVSVGDGGGGQSSNLSQNKSHDLSYPNGKILRVNLDASVPSDNPYGTSACKTTWGTSGATCGEIFAVGLRNPFRLAFDRTDPGVRFRILDVGLNTWEEVDEGAAHHDYGWPTYEGPCKQGSSSDCPDQNAAGVTPPVLWYNQSTGCSVETGGAFVPTGAWAGYEHAFLWVDFGCGKIFVAQPGQTGTPPATLATGAGETTDLEFFQQNGAWALYYTTYRNGGELRRVTAPPPATPAPPPIEGLKFTAVSPTRLLDTRSGLGAGMGKLKPGTTIALQVTGGVVPANAKAVVLNLTATLADGPGYITAWPGGQNPPPTSSLNVSATGETAANAAVVPIGAGGLVNLFTLGGAHLVADVTGYFSDAGGSTDGRFSPTPALARLLDTRNGTGGKSGPFGAGASFDLQVAGKGGVPGTGVNAVALTVTYTGPTAPGYLTVWPTGEPQPTVSTTNPNGLGDIRSNLALVKLGAGGKVSILSFQPTDVVVDVVGYFTSHSGSTGLFTAITPSRIADSREASAPFARLRSGTEGTEDFTNFVSSNATGALYNLTATNTVAGGYITAHPAGTPLPDASSVNWSGPQQHRAALTISSLASARMVGLFDFSDTDAIIDLAGWFTA